MIRAGIFGATGYTGYELVKLLDGHPQAEIVFGTSRRSAGQNLRDLYPCPIDLSLSATEDAALEDIDVAFSCLPHGQAMGEVARARAAGALRLVSRHPGSKLRCF